jgi:hypothetical protein
MSNNMIELIEKMSKDGETWVDFVIFTIPEGNILLMDENYHLKKFRLLMDGWIYWKTETRQKGAQS